ncbi:MAG: cation:proton antiporter [Verrucomicrobia bacterium]|jgi:Kef-type K+ transport system membrane component KefB|nr:cation:proton antiporter [Verrucomicrobiota bacterium]
MESLFLRQLGWIVIGAAVCSLVARSLKLPSIIAYLVAGLILGPWTGLVELTGSLELISEAGIVLLLFLVGLELSLDKIKGVGKVVLLAGLAQVALTFAGGFLLSRALSFDLTESVFLALALTFSSTVVAVKLLEEKQQFNSLHGRVAVGILLFQDLVVILLLTLLDGFKPGVSLDLAVAGESVLQALGRMLVLIVAVMTVSRYVLPRPFAWAARSPAALFIWSLCWCFFVVAAAHWLHLSEETGAFLAGLSLAQLPYNHDLRRRVHPLMNFFIAVFFVSLGVQMDLGAATKEWDLALYLALFAIAGKFAIVMFTLARLKFAERTAHFTSTTLAQISEFSFILTAAAVQAHWVSPRILSLVGWVGLVSFSLSACFIIYNEVLYFWSRHLGLLKPFLAPRHNPKEVKPRHRFNHIIVVGMNTLGREIARRLHERGESVLAVDTDPHKLEGLPCDTLLGDVEYQAVLEEAELPHARLLVSALRIEPTNDLLAFRCKQAGIPSSIQVVDLSVTDNLLEMDVKYLMISKVDGIKLQNRELLRRGLLKA